MRLFQNSGVYRSYRPRLSRLTTGCTTFESAVQTFLGDRFGAVHVLKPVLDGEPDAFFANGDDEFAQRLWAREQGLSAQASLEEILLAQIEHHRTEVFYNMDPMRYGDDFLARLPGSVRRTVAWRAAPSAGGSFLKHDIIVNNFPTMLDQYRAQGARAEYFTPAHDPEMDPYAARTDRPIDVLFVGTYSRHHRVRASLLKAIAQLRDRMTIVMHLDTSRYTRLAETPLGWVGPLRKDRRARAVRAVARPPVFGRDLLEAISNAKIVLNGSIDMAGPDRGNMRVWETLGCGAAMVSDNGRYPEGMTAGTHFECYDELAQVPVMLKTLLADPDHLRSVAEAGHHVIKSKYDKLSRWQRFQEIAS